MMHTFTPSRVVVGVLSLAALLLLSACSTPPKPPELVELEKLRSDRYTTRIRQLEGAQERIKQSDDFYKLAMEAYDDEEMGRTSEYATLGVMRYRTAEAIARIEDAKARLSVANDKFLKFQKIKNETTEDIGLIEDTIAVLQKQKTMAANLAAKDLAIANEAEKRKLQELKANARKTIDDAIVKRTEAEGLKATEFAATEYGKGKTMLKSAEKLFAQEKYNEAIETAQEANSSFVAAIGVARPKFNSEQDVVKQEELKKKLFEEAHNRFRELVRVDGRGMIITVDSLFKPGRTELQDDKQYVLDFIANLSKKYPQFNLMVEGHTAAGGARNITISQRRAEAARDYLTQRGIAANKVQTAGVGGDKPFFKNRGRERWRNERVDVVFLYQ